MIDLAKIDIRAIAAVGKSRQIGFKGKIPWNVEQKDIDFFNKQTSNNIIIFGGKTNWDTPYIQALSGKPDRTTHVWDRKYKSKQTPQEYLKEVIDYNIKKYPLKYPSINHADFIVWIAGGEQTYRTFAPFVKSISLTVVDYNGDADKWFPFEDFPLFFNEKGAL